MHLGRGKCRLCVTNDVYFNERVSWMGVTLDLVLQHLVGFPPPRDFQATGYE
ncbi:MAG: hypothetical protein EWM72_02808 [Nitrospira sp.]|nr:MAG: hypothetical protein EWM72_02808 [Nitrospira sp.]